LETLQSEIAAVARERAEMTLDTDLEFLSGAGI
jgi:hypothetical protein